MITGYNKRVNPVEMTDNISENSELGQYLRGL